MTNGVENLGFRHICIWNCHYQLNSLQNSFANIFLVLMLRQPYLQQMQLTGIAWQFSQLTQEVINRDICKQVLGGMSERAQLIVLNLGTDHIEIGYVACFCIRLVWHQRHQRVNPIGIDCFLVCLSYFVNNGYSWLIIYWHQEFCQLNGFAWYFLKLYGRYKLINVLFQYLIVGRVQQILLSGYKQKWFQAFLWKIHITR